MGDIGSGRDGGHGEADKDRLIEELREAVRARDEFVAIAAHELRNPMTPILMQVHNLAAAARSPRRCRPEILAPRLELLEHAVRDFVRRSTALLDVSRVAAGNLRIEPAAVDLSAVVRGVVGRVGVAARMARSPLQADLQEGVVGTWDRLALEQVAENLLSKALVRKSADGRGAAAIAGVQAVRRDAGMPSRAMRLSTEQPTLASAFWPGRVRARRRRPMMALWRDTAVSPSERLP